MLFSLIGCATIWMVAGAQTDCGPNRLSRFAELANCFSGDGFPAMDAGCEAYDSDADLDIDLVDYHAFLRPAFTTFGYPAGPNAWRVVAGDVDCDGDIDLVTGNWLSATISVLRNNGNATFGPADEYPSEIPVSDLDFLDFDADGDLDLVVVSGGEQAFILLNDGAGAFSPATDVPLGGSCYLVVGTNANTDAYGDVFVRCENGGMRLLVNDGVGGFSTPQPVVGSDGVPVVSDLDDDGDMDLVTSSLGHLFVLHNDGNGAFSFGYIGFMGKDALRGAGDLDGDGDLDLAHGWGHYLVLRYDVGGNIFCCQFDGYEVAHPTYIWQVIIEDLDSDGDGDLLLTTSTEQGSVSLVAALQDGPGGFSAPIEVLALPSLPWYMESADLDGDADIDLAVPADDQLYVLLNGCAP